ncbi:MAG: SDR family oxidoreductase [Bacteroidia bacterium]
MPNTALITGSTSGIGKATALALAKKGWHIIIHGRNQSSCLQTIAELKSLSNNPKIDFIHADISDLKQVKNMADEIKQRFPQLNILINNASTFSQSRKLTSDGLEQTWVVNYLSRFLLTNLLLSSLKANAPSRIIDVSGMYHAKGKIHFEDINLKQGYTMNKANSQSKLANVLFTYHLARQLEGEQVTINTLHPGAVNTGSILKAEGISAFAKMMYRMFSVFLKTPEQGAKTSVYLASSAEVEGVSGKYFVGSKAKRSSEESYDLRLQEQLWEVSEGMVDI